MAKNKKADASKVLVELDQPEVNPESQAVIDSTELEPGVFNEPEVLASTELDVTATSETQEDPASTKLEFCSSVAEPQETANTELELEQTPEMPAGPTNTEQELCSAGNVEVLNDDVSEHNLQNEEAASQHAEQEIVNQVESDAQREQQDEQPVTGNQSEPPSQQIKKAYRKKTSQPDLNRIQSSLSALSSLCVPSFGYCLVSLPSKININIHYYYHTDK